MNIHKGDTVQIKAGKDKGKTGKVLNVDMKKFTVLVEGINLFKKHSRPKRQGEKGETITLPRPFDYSKAMLYCSNCRKGVRSGQRIGTEKKQRYCKNCKTSI